MTSPDNRVQYTQRMHRALEHIDKHLERSIDLSELADVAHLSRFHFHRVFSAWLGETFGDYLRRRRLEVAASRLDAQPRVPVLSIALSVGFGSTEAFSRAFKGRFGCTPTQWRARAETRRSHSNPDQSLGNSDQASDPESLHPDVSEPRIKETIMKVSVIERQPVKVAYLRHVGPYGEELSRFWQEVAYPWMLSNNLIGRPRYGISHDDPGVTAPENCRYDAAVEVTAPLAAPGEATITKLPGGKYAVTPFSGTSTEIGAVWNQLLRDWMPASGLQLDSRPFLEHYGTDSSFDPETGVFTCELAIPVAPL
jgi:AraC family transcriptional regulator